MAVVVKKFDDILRELITYVVARSDLTDVSESAVLRHVLAATARTMDEFYFQLEKLPSRLDWRVAAGDDLDARIAEVGPYMPERTAAQRASGTVVFSRPGTVGVTSIPIGTAVKTATGVKFTTQAAGSITGGNTTSAAVSVLADVEGTSGNVGIGDIALFDSRPSGITGVTNGAAFTNGADAETDASLRERFRLHIASLARGTVQSLLEVTLGARLSTGQRVVSANVVEDPLARGEVTVYIDDGAGTVDAFTTYTAELVTSGLGGPGGNAAVGGEEYLNLVAFPVRYPDVGFELSSPANMPHFAGRGVLSYGIDYTFDDATGQIYFTPPLSSGEQIEADYSAYIGLGAEVHKLIYGVAADRVNYPGVRAAGTRVRVRSPQVNLVSVAATLSVRAGYSVSQAISDASTAVSAYINSLGIGEDVVRNEIIERVMALPSVYNVTLSTPASDIILLDTQLARTTSSLITIS